MAAFADSEAQSLFHGDRGSRLQRGPAVQCRRQGRICSETRRGAAH